VHFYANSILSKRPPTFSQPEIPELPDLPQRNELLLFGKRVPVVPFAIAICVLLGFPGILYILGQLPVIAIPPASFIGILTKNINTLTLVWGFGIAIALYCYAYAAPRKKIRDTIIKAESEVLDGVYLLAMRMSEGRAPEEALHFTAESMPNSRMGELFAEAANTVKRRNVTLEQACFDKRFGCMRGVYSKTVQSIMHVFVASVRKGFKSAAEILFVVVNYFSELKKIEKELRDMLSKHISMLNATVAFFAPMICGIVVVMYQAIHSSLISAQQQYTGLGYAETFTSQFLFIRVPEIAAEVLQLIVGIYLILLSIILVRYVSIIENGPDEVELKLRLAKVIPLALVVFTGTLLLVRNMII
jgi:hypothetical protein